ncbi:unnamed protein product [Phytophthora lilii]|uniref:Unnamed protein product n=1 Tax=Phytophthora lilii TaxID=2077276 RepID=A0A9W6WMJ8_9STRA|nr:unnamed protein product [Phytophthora lilii]
MLHSQLAARDPLQAPEHDEQCVSNSSTECNVTQKVDGKHASSASAKSTGLQDDNHIALPVLRFSRPSVNNDGESGDNQTAHLTNSNTKIQDSEGENQSKSSKLKRWACAATTHSSNADEVLLPQLAVRPAAPLPKKVKSPLRRAQDRKTWSGIMKPHGNERSHPDHRFSSMRRRASSSDATLATFEATETILVAELDADERCAGFLRQRAPRETLVYHPDDDDSPQSQIHYKLRALDRKIKMNKEKLTHVRERIVELGGKPSCWTVISSPEATERHDHDTDKPEQVKDNHMSSALEAKMGSSKLKPEALSAVTAALMIQCAFRVHQARRCLAQLLAKTYHRVLNPGNNHYFYYNRITRLSQWEPPLLLHRCPSSLDAKPKQTAAQETSVHVASSDPTLDAAARTIQNMFRQRALRVFMKDLRLGNLEKVFDTGFGAWYYFNSRTNRSFWESVHHVRLTAANSAVYHRHQPWQAN